MREFLRKLPLGPLFHYTDSNGLIGILERKEIWATNALHLNDAKEFVHAMGLLRLEIKKRLTNSETAERSYSWNELYEEWESKSEPLETDIYLISFSINGNQLSQWRAYCPKGSGYSLGFGMPDLAYCQKNSGFRLVQCIYDRDQQDDLIRAVVDYIDQGWRKSYARKNAIFLMSRLWRKAIAVMLAMKHEGFREEQEWRLVGNASQRNPVRFRPGRFGVTPYCALPLSGPDARVRLEEVWLGPNAEPERAKAALTQALNQYADLNKEPISAVRVSDVPYRYY